MGVAQTYLLFVKSKAKNFILPAYYGGKHVSMLWKYEKSRLAFRKSRFCSGKVWETERFPNKIRRMGFAHTRKTVSLRPFGRRTHLFFLYILEKSLKKLSFFQRVAT